MKAALGYSHVGQPCSELVGSQKLNSDIRFSWSSPSDVGQHSHVLFITQSLWQFHIQILKQSAVLGWDRVNFLRSWYEAMF